MDLNFNMCILVLLNTSEQCPVRHLDYFEEYLDVAFIPLIYIWVNLSFLVLPWGSP